MFDNGRTEDNAMDLGEINERLQSGTTRSKDRNCDICGESNGSVIVERKTDTARCSPCFNDPETWDD